MADKSLIVDQFGKDIQPTTPSGKRQYVGSIDYRDLDYPIIGLSPSKLESIFTAADDGDVSDWYELCEHIEATDSQIASKLATRKKTVLACKQSIEPYRSYAQIAERAPATAEDREVADYCREVIFGLHCWEDRCKDLLDGIAKGISVVNVDYQKDRRYGRYYSIRDLIWMPARILTFESSLEPLLTRTDGNTEPLRPFEWIIHTPNDRSVEPYRAGLMRVLVWYFLLKHANLKFWISFLETHAHPLRLGYYAPGASENTKQALWYAIKRLSTDQAALVERTTDFEPFEQRYPETSQASESFLKFVAHCDDAITQVVLGQQLTTEAGTHGSYAQANVHAKVGDVYLADDAKELMNTVRRDLIRPLVYYNFGKDYVNRLPRLVVHYEPSEDLESRSRTLYQLGQLGMTFSRRQLEQEFHLDPISGDGDAVAYNPQGAGFTPQGEPPPPETPPDEQAKRAHASNDDRPTGDPAVIVPKQIAVTTGQNLPGPVADAVEELSAVVDGFNAKAMDVNHARIVSYLVRNTQGFTSEADFAEWFMQYWDRNWAQYWGTDGISKGSLYPFLNKIYKHYKLVDKVGGLESLVGEMTRTDQRVVDFMTRADSWYFSRFVDNQSFRGPMQRFLLQEYSERGGMLFGEKNKAVIEGFKKAAQKYTHDLSRYEVDRIIKTGVQRSRQWARLSQMSDAGVEYYEIVNGPNPCEFCAAVNGQKVAVASEFAWVESTFNMTDDQFREELDSRIARHREGVRNDASPAGVADSIHSPPFHPNCSCNLVAVI